MKNYTIEKFYDLKTFTLSYIVFDSITKDSVVIDCVLDYDANSGKCSYKSLDELTGFITTNNLKVNYILETHAHADHLSGAIYVKNKYPNAKIGIGSEITAVQDVFKDVFNLNELMCDGSQFDHLFKDGEVVKTGSISFEVMYTPGHTPACVSFLFKDDQKTFVFTGDALFIPDYGTGRCDFPSGSAEALYDSIKNKLYTLSDETVLYVGHDYKPGGRELRFETTVKESKEENIRLKGDTSKEDFVTFRKKRDETLSTPKLLLPSIQVNINGGKMPAPEGNGVSYLKIPLSHCESD
jgi:glyoxylase-like metal-dependent hydrolase (beta-lactamase superfamily II)